ncbi:DUF4983 domain-containing protein [Paraflavitalea sp. CAU 1676]|uniref:DUF4983 domain-containing protein n=1 Tax=Paraflavitalea sp. CAU 1676 TaxID=3032598 RepID=UPI0023DB3F82|nr:DUF4983 domain-containing protein [Paraflavitalea sp. CAU 1676]MDF2188082.1 DUF4983 domain-containing protein [Paraflavitalea sp. CAU 1676]
MNNRKQITGIALLAAAVIGSISIPACKKYDDPPPFFEEDDTTVVLSSRKTLLVVIDGGVAEAFRTIAPPSITTMLTHGKYTYTGRTEDVSTDGASWKSLASGVSYTRHKISDSSLVFSAPSGGDLHDAPANFPSFMQFILTSSRSDIQTTVISPWGYMINKLFPEAEKPIAVTSDAAVKDSAVAQLKNGNPDLMITHFNGISAAGKEFGFDANVAEYKAAVLKVDGYINEIMTALKARKEYNKKEEWLVIVTTSHGGLGKSFGGSSAAETNVFTLYYNENIKKQELIRGGYVGVQMKGKDATAIAASLADGTQYNPERNQQTVQIRVKGTSGAYPHFFSKMQRWPSTPGWSMFSSGSNWSISVRSTTSGELRIQPGSPTVFNNQWHTITIVFADSASKRWLRRYTDGVRHDQTELTSQYANGGTYTNSSPLTIGFGSDPTYTSSVFYSADAMVFNTALTDAEIKDNICLRDLTKHPQYASLVGYWPGSDGYGGQFINKAPNQTNNFVLKGSYKWDGLSDVPCTLDPLTTTQVAVQPANVDVVAQIFYWMRITIKSDWSLDGGSWIKSFEREFIKL